MSSGGIHSSVEGGVGTDADDRLRHVRRPDKADGVDDEAARKAAAETGELYVNVEANKVRLNILISIVVAGFVVVIGLLFQIAMRIPAGVD